MANDLKYALAFYLTFGGVPASLLALAAALRRRVPAPAWAAVALAYGAMYRADSARPFGRDSAGFRRLLNRLIVPLFEEQGGAVLLDEPIDPKGVYCVCGAPHGVIPLYFMGVTDWFRYGPERKSPIALGASVIFAIPGLREIFLNFAMPGTPQNFARLARAQRSMSIVPGGVHEMLLQQPGNRVRIIALHKGFVKLCLEHGVSMLPVFAFGENNMWVQTRPRQSIANLVKTLTRGWYPFYFEGEYLCIPKRGPVIIVSAEPIAVPKIESPSEQVVEEYHELFYKTLSDLIRRYKAQLEPFNDLQVEFIGKPHLNIDWIGSKL